MLLASDTYEYRPSGFVFGHSLDDAFDLFYSGPQYVGVSPLPFLDVRGRLGAWHDGVFRGRRRRLESFRLFFNHGETHNHFLHVYWALWALAGGPGILS